MTDRQLTAILAALDAGFEKIAGELRKTNALIEQLQAGAVASGAIDPPDDGPDPDQPAEGG